MSRVLHPQPGFDVRRVLIIGAGPAGSVAGAVLARGGVEVTLIEASRFPRDKVCGECLSDLGIQTLRDQGMSQTLPPLVPTVLRHSRLVAADGSEMTLPLPRPMWGLTRRAMDAALLDAARSAGVRVLQPARAEHLEPGPRPAVFVRHLSGEGSTATRRLAGDLILLADGRSNFPTGKPKPTGDLGLKAHFRHIDAPPGTIGLFGVDGHYVGLAPVSDGEGVVWNLACNVPAARMKAFGADQAELLRAMLSENPALARAMARAEQISDWHASPLPRFGVRRQWPQGIIPLGNAAAALEPVGGEGMGLAVASAALAARAVLEGRTSREDLDGLQREFERLWRVRRPACRSAALLLSGRLGPWSVGLGRLAPSLADLGMRLVGK